MSILDTWLRRPSEEDDGATTDSETEASAPEPEPEQADNLPAPAGENLPDMFTQIRAGAALAKAAAKASAKQKAAQHGGLVNRCLNAQAPSVTGHLQYGHNRSWVTPGHEHGLLDRAGARYNRRAAWIVALAQLIGGLAKHAIRGHIAAAFGTVLLGLVLWSVLPHLLIILGAAGLWVIWLGSLFV